MPTTIANTLDPTSQAYKKAKRQYWKTTRGRSDQIEADWSPFRAAEKKYKAKFPPPDLSGVLDLAALDDTQKEELGAGGWMGSTDAVEYQEIELLQDEEQPYTEGRQKAYIFSRVPGLVVLPSFISPTKQRDLVRWSLKGHARYPNETNLDTHYILPEGGLWDAYERSSKGSEAVADIQPRISTSSTLPSALLQSGPRQLISNEPASKENYMELVSESVAPAPPSPNARSSPPDPLVPRLRWANIGWYYHWGNKQYDFTRGKIPVSEIYSKVCKQAVKIVPWDKIFRINAEDSHEDWGDEPKWDCWAESYEPDAGIVNFYQTKDTLMAHVDRSEICATSPLVSISLGCAAVFLIGGTSRDVEPMSLLLRSGDVVIMSGPRCRRAYHGVPRVLEGTLPSHFTALEPDPQDHSDWSLYEKYLRTTRININVRQVFPKGFDAKLPA